MSTAGLICGYFNDPCSARYLPSSIFNFPRWGSVPWSVNIWGVWYDEKIYWFDPRSSQTLQSRDLALSRGGLLRAAQCTIPSEEVETLISSLAWLQAQLNDYKVRLHYLLAALNGTKYPFGLPELISYLEEPPYWLHEQELVYNDNLVNLTAQAEPKTPLNTQLNWVDIDLSGRELYLTNDWDENLIPDLLHSWISTELVQRIKYADWSLLNSLFTQCDLTLAELVWQEDLRAIFGQCSAAPILLPASSPQFDYQQSSTTAVLYATKNCYPRLLDNLLYYWYSCYGQIKMLELPRLLRQCMPKTGGYYSFPVQQYQLTLEHLWIAKTNRLTILADLLDIDACLFYIGCTWSDEERLLLGTLNNDYVLRRNYKSRAIKPYIVCARTNLWALLLLDSEQWQSLTNDKDCLIKCWQGIRDTCGKMVDNRLIGLSFYSNSMQGRYRAGQFENLEIPSHVISCTASILALYVLNRLNQLYPEHNHCAQWKQDIKSIETELTANYNHGLPIAITKVKDADSEQLVNGQKLIYPLAVDWFTTQLYIRYQYQLPILRQFSQKREWLW